MKKKKVIENAFLEGIDLRYAGVDYDYDRCTNCERAGCDYICRCSKIVDAHVTKVDIAELISYHFKQFEDDPVKLYAVDRLLRLHRVYAKDSYNIDIWGGYYGEEISSVTWDNAQAFDKDLRHALSLELEQIIEFLIEKEYSGVLEPITDVYTTRASILDLEFTHKGLFKKQTYDLVPDIPIGIYKKVGTKHVVIDGNHRLAHLKSQKDCDPKQLHSIIVVQ